MNLNAIPATPPARLSPDECYQPKDIERLLPIGRTGVYRLLRENKIPHMRLGKKIVIPKAAFESWLNSCGQVNPSREQQA